MKRFTRLAAGGALLAGSAFAIPTASAQDPAPPPQVEADGTALATEAEQALARAELEAAFQDLLDQLEALFAQWQAYLDSLAPPVDEPVPEPEPAPEPAPLPPPVVEPAPDDADVDPGKDEAERSRRGVMDRDGERRWKGDRWCDHDGDGVRDADARRHAHDRDGAEVRPFDAKREKAGRGEGRAFDGARDKGERTGRHGAAHHRGHHHGHRR
ncbi:MAG TPA: hypothetical protein VK007_10895 [Acidimicrobiales bacterium]|nr:hypothetical protein [Acidimicrobiales bacterium]